MSQPTALNFMRVTTRFGSITANFADLPVSVIYQLAAPSTPDEVVDRVTSGEVTPNVAEVKRAIARWLELSWRYEEHLADLDL